MILDCGCYIDYRFYDKACERMFCGMTRCVHEKKIQYTHNIELCRIHIRQIEKMLLSKYELSYRKYEKYCDQFYLGGSYTYRAYWEKAGLSRRDYVYLDNLKEPENDDEKRLYSVLLKIRSMIDTVIPPTLI